MSVCRNKQNNDTCSTGYFFRELIITLTTTLTASD